MTRMKSYMAGGNHIKCVCVVDLLLISCAAFCHSFCRLSIMIYEVQYMIRFLEVCKEMVGQDGPFYFYPEILPFKTNLSSVKSAEL